MFEGFRFAKARSSKPAAPAPVLLPPGAVSPQAARSSNSSTGRKRTLAEALGGSPTASGSASAPAPAPKPKPKPAKPGAAAAAQPAGAGGGGELLEKFGEPERPLRLVIVGHNPSDHAWSSGHFYSNPTNWMWRILKETGIAPPEIRGAEDDGRMPALAGVGFTDVGMNIPGTQSSQFKPAHFEAWRQPFFQRLAAHAMRSSAEGMPACRCGRCGAPAVVAFSGKRQFQELFPWGPAKRGRKQQQQQQQQATPAVAEKMAAAAAAAGAGGRAGPSSQQGDAKEAAGTEGREEALAAAGVGRYEGTSAAATAKTNKGSTGGREPPWQQQEGRQVQYQQHRPESIETGRQWMLPEGWPLPASTEVWVMTSTSGAAAMSREQRLAPWRALAERLQREPWPRLVQAQCGGESEAGVGGSGAG